MTTTKFFSKQHHKVYPKVSFLIALLFLIFSSACKQERLVDDSFDCLNSHWAYEGPSDPYHWSTCYSDCGGTLQSPVDISAVISDDKLNELQMKYDPSPIDLHNNGHTVKFDYNDHGVIHFDGEAYTLKQFHFHTLSEHTVNGQHYPMEVHLVHQDASGQKAVVVAVFVEQGQENAFLKNFSEHLPSDDPSDHTYGEAKEVNVGNLLPTDHAYYTYSGSLTTPPCSQIVSWVIMKNPVPASADQLGRFESILHHNYRPTQDLNGRQIREKT